MKRVLTILLLIFIVIIPSFFYLKKINSPKQPVIDFFDSIKNKDSILLKKAISDKTFIDNSFRLRLNYYDLDPNDDLISEIDKILNQYTLEFLEDDIKESIASFIEDFYTSNHQKTMVDNQFYYDFLNNIFFDEISITNEKIIKNKAIVECSFFNLKYESYFKAVFLLDKQSSWKIIGIVNINEILDKIKSLEKKRRNVSIKNKTLEMNRFLVIKEYSLKNTYEEFLRIDLPEIDHFIVVKNVGNIGINRFKLKITFKDNTDSITVEQEVVYDHYLDVNEEKKISFKTFNPFLKTQVESGFLPEINHVSIQFEDGTSLINEENQEMRFYE